MGSTADGNAIDVADLFVEHHERLEDYIRHRLRDAPLAEDLVAETYLRAYQGRARFVGDRDDRIKWLYGIANNVLGDYWRHREVSEAALRRLPCELDVDGDDEREDILRADARPHLEQVLGPALRRLPDSQREALDLRVVGELPYDQIATRQRVNSQLARARVSRGLAALAATIVAAGLETLI